MTASKLLQCLIKSASGRVVIKRSRMEQERIINKAATLFICPPLFVIPCQKLEMNFYLPLISSWFFFSESEGKKKKLLSIALPTLVLQIEFFSLLQICNSQNIISHNKKLKNQSIHSFNIQQSHVPAANLRGILCPHRDLR